MSARIRIGQIVPSSNTTMETELPAMLRAREAYFSERFSFHSSRMRMRTVVREELEQMDRQAERCAAELADAQVDIIGYACLVAIMSQDIGYHRPCEARLTAVARENGARAQVVSSAGALVEAAQALKATCVSVITPYQKPLTELVVRYLEAEGIAVCDAVSLEITDNLAVGRRDPLALVEVARRLDVSKVDAIVLSACVQMPSFDAVSPVEREMNRPVITAATATAWRMLKCLDLEPVVPEAGALLNGHAK